MYQKLLIPIYDFLHCETPAEWIKEAVKEHNLPVLLIDHMICELKAAQTAAWLLRRYVVEKHSGELLLQWLKPYEDFIYRHKGDIKTLVPQRISKKLIPLAELSYASVLVEKMVLLIKEELHHFYQVLEIMAARQISYKNISAGRYAKTLMRGVKTYEPQALIDKLICGAYIEARSCERFAKLAPYLEPQLQTFYWSLLRSEARHYQDYLSLATMISTEELTVRIDYFGRIEAQLIVTADPLFRFHSGVPY